MRLVPDEPMKAVLFRETVDEASLVLPNASYQVIGDADESVP